MGDNAPGLSRGRGRPKKYATAEEARAARNAARRNRRLEEAATDEAAAVARREQHAALMRRRRSENADLVRREAAAARAKRAALRGKVRGPGQVVTGAARATAKYKKGCVGSPLGAVHNVCDLICFKGVLEEKFYRPRLSPSYSSKALIIPRNFFLEMFQLIITTLAVMKASSSSF